MIFSVLLDNIRILLFLSITGILTFQSCKQGQDSNPGANSNNAAASKALAEISKIVFSEVDTPAKAVLDASVFEGGSAADQIRKYVNSGFSDYVVFKFNSMNFSTGSADLSPEILRETEQLSILLKAYPKLKLRLESHTDNTGDAPLNQMLSELRARNIVNILTAKQGISAERITLKAFGQEKPLESNETEEGRAANSRIEIYLEN
jgi:outer membrane protein OmpA-like peptidoglycan-associated protein